jgi:class 3 adenylate cyclase
LLITISISRSGDLTDQHLKDLGVASLGHRLKILRAIAELDRQEAKAAPPAAARAPPSGSAPRSPFPTPVATPPQTTPRPQEAAGERRYLTVVFCDLVDSTGIAAKLDAEEWRDLVNAYLDDASAAVMEMGGHVAKKLGDGLMALFGYPLAHENDAERAARAALSIQRALADLNRKNAGIGKPELRTRIGLETGPAVVDAGGEIYGDVTNIAARVQALAEPGAVLITARVQRQVAGLFVVEERGTHKLKGRARADAAVPARPRERRRTPFRRASAYALRRPRGGNGDADAALGARASKRRAISADRRRAGHWQVSSD